MSNRTNHLDQMGPRDIGRKNKPTPRRAADECDYKVGATQKLIYVRRKNPAPNERRIAQIPVIEGGKKCTKHALVRKPTGERRCVEHIAAIYPNKKAATETATD